MSPPLPRAELRVLRGTRLRLALWSGGTTLVVLLILDAVVDAFEARQLARDSEEQLRVRASHVAALKDPSTDAAADELALVAAADKTGVLFGGPLSGTIAVTATTAKYQSTDLADKDAAKTKPITERALAAKKASAALGNRIAAAVADTSPKTDGSMATQ